MSNNNTPNQEQVKLIFKETYLLYLDGVNSKLDEEFQRLIRKSHEIKTKYPFELCETIILKIWDVISDYSKEAHDGKNSM